MNSQELLQRVKPFLKRSVLEKVTVLILLISAVMVLIGHSASQKTLSLDQGKIIYQGQVYAGKMSGKGEVTYANKDRYKGDFSQGVFQGKGTFTSHEGWSYTGEFQKGVPNGQGTLTTEENVVYKGIFKEGIYQYAD